MKDSPLVRILNISSGVGSGNTCGEIIGLIVTLKSPQIQMPPSFFGTTTIGVVQSDLSTGRSSPCSTSDLRSVLTFSLRANGTGRCLQKQVFVFGSTSIVASIPCRTPN